MVNKLSGEEIEARPVRFDFPRGGAPTGGAGRGRGGY